MFPQAPSNASDRAALKALERENALLAQTIAELRADRPDGVSGEDYIYLVSLFIIRNFFLNF